MMARWTSPVVRSSLFIGANSNNAAVTSKAQPPDYHNKNQAGKQYPSKGCQEKPRSAILAHVSTLFSTVFIVEPIQGAYTAMAPTALRSRPSTHPRWRRLSVKLDRRGEMLVVCFSKIHVHVLITVIQVSHLSSKQALYITAEALAIKLSTPRCGKR